MAERRVKGLTSMVENLKKEQAEKEALDPDANYTEDKGDFEIPTDMPDEAKPRTSRTLNPSDFTAAFAAVHIQMKTDWRERLFQF